MLPPMTNSPEKKLVAEALLGLTAQQALILQRCVQVLCTRETPRSGVVTCDELNAVRRIIDELPSDAWEVA